MLAVYVFSILLSTAFSGLIEYPVSQTCLSCMCKVATTSCTNVPCYLDRGSACGYYQIHYGYYIDCYKPEPESGCRGLTERECSVKCSRDKKCAERCVQLYMLRYRNKNGAGDNCESYVRLHVGGPFGAAKWYNRTTSYWNYAKAYGCSWNS